MLNGDSVCYKDTIRITSQAMAVNYTTDNDSIKDATYRWINNFNVASISDDQRTTDLIVDNQSPSYRLYAVSPFDTFCEVDTLIPSVKPYPYPAVYLESPISIGRDGDHIFTPIVYSSVADQNYYWHDKSNYLAATSTELSPTLHFNTNDGSSDTLMFDLSYGKILTSKAQCMLRLSAILNFVGGVDPQSKTLGNNALTPNDDGYNDYWMIKNAEYYPNNHVEIFNRWGQKVYSETGYNNNDKVWRGNYNGGRLPSGVYYYVIKLNSTSKAITGTVTIIR